MEVQNCKGLIFDLDGTLVDSVPGIAQAVNAVLTRLGYPPRTENELAAMMGNGARNLIHKALPQEDPDPELTDQALALYDQVYLDCCVEGASVYEGVREVISQLQERGIPMAVLSNKQDPCTKKIVYTLFGETTFAFVQGQTDAPKKPSPAVPLQIAAQFGLQPEEMGVVGDTEVDLETARRAKMTPITVLWGYRSQEDLLKAGANYFVEAPMELLDVMENQNNQIDQDQMDQNDVIGDGQAQIDAAPAKKKRKCRTDVKHTRLTKQKQLLLNFFREYRDRNFTAEEVMTYLDDSNHHLGLATIYRNLKSFEEDGKLVRITLSGDSAVRYRYGGDNPVVQSYHKLLCNRCGKITNLDTDLVKRLERVISSSTGHAINDHQLMIYGVCKACRTPARRRK